MQLTLPTLAPVDNPLTYTVTNSPPCTDPLDGDTPVTCSCDTNSNDKLDADDTSTPFNDTDNDDTPTSITGVRHTISLGLLNCAATDTKSNRHDSSLVNTNPDPNTLTWLPPVDGPQPGATELNTTSPSYTNSLPPPLTKSAPLLLTLTTQIDPTDPPGETHCTSEEDNQRARTFTDSLPLTFTNLQLNSSESTKWLPYTVTTVPPTLLPRTGNTDSTLASDSKWNITLSDVKSFPFNVTSTATPKSLLDTSDDVTVVDAGDTHVTVVDDTNDAGTIAVPKRHANASVFSNPDPVTVTNVPPEEAPTRGDKLTTWWDGTNVKFAEDGE
jgi:hypothetical protein